MFQFLGSTARCCVVLAGLCLALGCSDRGLAALREDAGADSDAGDARACPAEAGESPIALTTPSGTIFGTLMYIMSGALDRITPSNRWRCRKTRRGVQSRDPRLDEILTVQAGSFSPISEHAHVS
jgi:hypothetical protein